MVEYLIGWMKEMNMSNDTADVCKKMVDAMRKSKGDQFALGYMESFLVYIIDKYVTDEKELSMMKIEMLGIACEYALEKIESK
jgi:HD-like signal output (HDOD) protein